MAFFVESLKGEEPSQFDTTMSQFMECAHACRQAKLEERAAADTSAQADRTLAERNAVALADAESELARVTAEKIELECMVDELSEAFKNQV